jgi:hypothetical protein
VKLCFYYVYVLCIHACIYINTEIVIDMYVCKYIYIYTFINRLGKHGRFLALSTVWT